MEIVASSCFIIHEKSFVIWSKSCKFLIIYFPKKKGFDVITCFCWFWWSCWFWPRLLPSPPLVHTGLHCAAHRHPPRVAVRLEAGLRGGVISVLPAPRLCGGLGPAGLRHPGEGSAASALLGLQAAPDPQGPGPEPEPLPAPGASGLGELRFTGESHHHVIGAAGSGFLKGVKSVSPVSVVGSGHGPGSGSV